MSHDAESSHAAPAHAPRRAAWRAILGGALLGGVGMAVVLFGVPADMARRFVPHGAVSPWLVGPVVVGAPFLAIAVHELGHLVAGLAHGFRFELFVVGPLGIRREGESVRVFFNRDVGMMGGIAATSPRSDAMDMRAVFGRILIAGPAASLLLALAAVGQLAVTSTPYDPFIGFVGLASVGILLATTLPSRTGLFFTDRKRWQRLRSGGEDGYVEQALLTMVTRSAVDGHHRALALDDIARLQRDREPFVQFLGDAFAYLRARDLGDANALHACTAALEKHTGHVPESTFRLMGLPVEPMR